MFLGDFSSCVMICISRFINNVDSSFYFSEGFSYSFIDVIFIVCNDGYFIFKVKFYC